MRSVTPTFGRCDPSDNGIARGASLRAAVRRAASGRRASSWAGHPDPPASGGSAVYQEWRHRAEDCDALRVRRRR
jgi:hypothetical protein